MTPTVDVAPEIQAKSAKRGKYGDGGLRELSKNRWQISFYDAQGRRRRKSFTTQAKAHKALHRAMGLKDAGKLDPKEGRIKINELAASYKVYAQNSAPKSYYWICLVWRVHLEPFFGGMVGERLGSDHIQEYIRERLDSGAATSTVNRELTILKAIFNHAAKADPPKIYRVPRFPERLREPNPRTGFLNDEQYDALQDQGQDAALCALLAVAYAYGFRKSELISLKVWQIDLKARMIHLPTGTTKNDKGRAVAITEEVYDFLADCVRAKRPEDCVFVWRTGKQKGQRIRDFRKTWISWVKRAGMPGLKLHDLRRAGVRNMIRAGVSKQVAKLISGHTSDSIFDRYDITDETDLIEAARKMDMRRTSNGHRMDTAEKYSL